MLVMYIKLTLSLTRHPICEWKNTMLDIYDQSCHITLNMIEIYLAI